jgi:hypothetical protein
VLRSLAGTVMVQVGGTVCGSSGLPCLHCCCCCRQVMSLKRFATHLHIWDAEWFMQQYRRACKTEELKQPVGGCPARLQPLTTAH